MICSITLDLIISGYFLIKCSVLVGLSIDYTFMFLLSSNLCKVAMLVFILYFKGKLRDSKAGVAKFQHHWVLSDQVCQND